MKLDKLYKSTDMDVLRSYMKDIRSLVESANSDKKLLSETKITITIDDSDKDQITKVKQPDPTDSLGVSLEARNNFIEKVKEMGDFSDEKWVNSLVRSMEQAGVQGFHKVCEEEKPVSSKQIRHLVELLINLVGG